MPKNRIRSFRSYLRDHEFIQHQRNKPLGELNGLDIQAYYDQLDIKLNSRKQYMTAVRGFIQYLERLELVKNGLSEKVYVPTIDKAIKKRDEEIQPERVKKIVEYLGRYRYASLDHVMMLLLWHTGVRIGGLHSLDLKDVTEIDGQPALEIRHRPDQGTRLKNGKDGERLVNLKEPVADTVAEYMDVIRNSQTDECGREPLLTSG